MVTLLNYIVPVPPWWDWSNQPDFDRDKPMKLEFGLGMTQSYQLDTGTWYCSTWAWWTTPCYSIISGEENGLFNVGITSIVATSYHRSVTVQRHVDIQIEWQAENQTTESLTSFLSCIFSQKWEFFVLIGKESLSNAIYCFLDTL